MKMQGYSRIRGSRSVDYDESKWKDCNTDLKYAAINGGSAFNCNGREQINGGKERGFVKESESMDPSGQAGFILGRALSLRESIKDKKFMKKNHGGTDKGDSMAKDCSNKSFQGAVKRVFSTRKAAPDQDKLYPHADFLSADLGFKRSESLRYNRIGSFSPPPFDLDADGSILKKKKRSVLGTCKRLLGMQRN